MEMEQLQPAELQNAGHHVDAINLHSQRKKKTKIKSWTRVV